MSEALRKDISSPFEELQREGNIAMKIGRVDYVMGYYDSLGLKFEGHLWTRTLKCLEIYCKTHGLDTTNEDRYEFVRIIANMPVEDIPLIRNAGTKIQREIHKVQTACRKYLHNVLKEKVAAVVAVVNVLEDGSIDGYLTLPQIAKKWGVTDNYLRVMIHREKLKPAFKIGTDWYFRSDAQKPIVKKGRPKKNG